MKGKSALERLAKKLDSRGENGDINGVRRSPLPPGRSQSAPEGWSGSAKTPSKRRRLQPLELFFIGSAAFFVIAAIFAAFLFFSGSNTVSTRNVAIAIDGPTEVRAGDSVALNIAITNRNAVATELTDLIVEFPPGTRSEADVAVELPRIRESIGTINPGESVNKTVRAVLFGQAESNAEIKVTVEYRVESSNAIFYSEAFYTVPISQSPASISVESLKEVVAGQETALTITVQSNVLDVLSDMLLVAEYPPGFSFSSATPAPAAGSAVWELGDIEPGGERTVTIRGTFSGEDGSERVVRLTAGTQSGSTDSEIAAPLATGDASVTIAKPFIATSLALDGNVTTEYIASRGQEIRGDIRWTNNLPNRAQDVEIEIKLDGQILDRASVTADRGFYRSGDNTIVFNRETDPRLADLAPGASGVSTFTFSSFGAGQGTFRNPEMNLAVTVRARRISETQVPELIESTSQAKVLIATDLALASSISSVSGPVPPQADNETVYAVSWTVSNTANAIANTSVSAVLPSYVRWANAASPGSESVSYNDVGGIVTWNIGDLAAGASRTVVFQVGVTPSLSQTGTAPTVVSDQRVYGFDRFTRTQLERAVQALTTRTGVSQQEGTVVP